VLKRLGEILGGNSGARLFVALIKTAGVVTNMTFLLDDALSPGMLSAQMALAPGKDPAQVLPLLDREIETLTRDGVSKEEMEQTEADTLRRRMFTLISTSMRAQVFVEFLANFKHLDAVNNWESRERAITNDDLKRVARKYLASTNRTVLTVLPGAKP
jgi:predicted Zn-dependent peptidase